MTEKELKELRDRFLPLKGTKHADLVLKLCKEYEKLAKASKLLVDKIKEASEK